MPKQAKAHMDGVINPQNYNNIDQLILQVDSFYLVYVYKKNKQINKWNKRINTKKKIRAW